MDLQVTPAASVKKQTDECTGVGTVAVRRASGAAMLLAVLLSACAVQAPRVRIPPTVVSADQTRALIAHTTAEWQRWGQRIVRIDVEPSCLVQPDGSCVEIGDGCGDEQTSALCPIVDEYWKAVPPHIGRHACHTVDICTAQWPTAELGRAFRTPAWSAAFVSAMMARAGFSTSEFWPSMTHAGYIVAAREGYASAFEVVPTPAVARPGDLLCATRSYARYTPADISAIEDGERAPPMHCDIVVAVDRAAGVLQAIGGNVQQTVARIDVQLDAQGRVTYAAGVARPWILVLRARR